MLSHFSLNFKPITALLAIFLSTSVAQANEKEEKMEDLLDYFSAQAGCSVYLRFLDESYKSAEFKSETVAKKAAQMHLNFSSAALEELFQHAIQYDFAESKKLIFKRKEQFCISDEICFNSVKHIEGMFLARAMTDAQQDITRKSKQCDLGEWEPCEVGEPVDNWQGKALDLYINKNCKLLLK